MKELSCTRYDVPYDDGWHMPCRCPICGGFLKWPSIEDIPICNKCHAELLVLPDVDEDTGEEMEWGKICPISKGKG